MMFKMIELEMEDGVWEEVRVNLKYEICSECNGHGKHTNRNIDGNGLSPEMEEDPEFMEDYLRGVYDVHCEVCDGTGKEKVVDQFYNSKEVLDAYYDLQRVKHELRMEEEAERRFGC